MSPDNQIEILIRKATEVVANEGMEAPPAALNLAATGLMVQRIDNMGITLGVKMDELGKALHRSETPKKPRRIVLLQFTSLAGIGAAVGILIDRILGR